MYSCLILSRYLLIHELKEINFVFLKGSALISAEVFDDIGERMIGDIDILVDKNKIDEAQRILKNNGYYETAKYFFLMKDIYQD